MDKRKKWSTVPNPLLNGSFEMIRLAPLILCQWASLVNSGVYQRCAFAFLLKIKLVFDNSVCPFTCDLERFGLVQLW
jgi:hypothetical protein